MPDVVNVAARAAAERLAPDFGPELVPDVEAALSVQGSARSEQYLDPVSLGSLIVSIVGLAWTIYTDLRKKSADPAPEVTRVIRIELIERGEEDLVKRDKITEAVVAEVIRAAS
jgi:hypothetical protein